MLGRILGALASWAGAVLCGYGVYKLAEMILGGASGGNWLMVIAGGVLAYIFGGLLVIGAIGLFLLGLVFLVD